MYNCVMDDENNIQEFSEDTLQKKIFKVAKKAGIKVIYLVLILFYTLQKKTTPVKAKSAIIGGLAYFILPFDFVSDLIPAIGFSDDLTALFSVLIAVAMYVDADDKRRAKERLKLWFGEYDSNILNDIDKKIKNENEN